MVRCPGWSHALSAVLFVTALGLCMSPSGPAHGQAVRGSVPGAGPLGPGPVVPWRPDPGPLGPGPLTPLTPLGPGPSISAPAGNPLSGTAIDRKRPAAETRAHAAARRTAERERMQIASAVKAIGQRNRESAAIVLKIRRVTP